MINDFSKGGIRVTDIRSKLNYPPTNVFQIKNEIIWGNRYILNNNKTLHMKRWIDADNYNTYW